MPCCCEPCKFAEFMVKTQHTNEHADNFEPLSLLSFSCADQRTHPDLMPRHTGFADDYAHMIAGLLDLYEAGGGTEWLNWAAQLQESMDGLFWDAEHGGYYGTSGADASIALRMKVGADA